MKTPLVSIVLPVYNAEKYIRETLASISNQTLSDWELIAINDGSTDASESILNNFAKNEHRMSVVSRQNKGLIATLNEGISLAKGKWIARMDADDICLPDRLSSQIEWATEQSADVCGGMIERIGINSGNSWVFPSSTVAINVWLLFRSAFAHPTIIINRNLALQFPYSSKYQHAEDYELWTRLAVNKTKMTNIQKKVLLYRVHEDQVSTSKKDLQTDTRVIITKKYWEESPLTEGLKLVDALVDERKTISRIDFLIIMKHFHIIQDRLYDAESKKVLSHHLTWFLYRSIHLGGKVVIPAIKELNMSTSKRFIISILSIFRASFIINLSRNASWIRWFPLKWFF